MTLYNKKSSALRRLNRRARDEMALREKNSPYHTHTPSKEIKKVADSDENNERNTKRRVELGRVPMQSSSSSVRRHHMAVL